MHGAEPSFPESVPVLETFQGQVVWEGKVQVFALKGHHSAQRGLTAAAWARNVLLEASGSRVG